MTTTESGGSDVDIEDWLSELDHDVPSSTSEGDSLESLREARNGVMDTLREMNVEIAEGRSPLPVLNRERRALGGRLGEAYDSSRFRRWLYRDPTDNLMLRYIDPRLYARDAENMNHSVREITELRRLRRESGDPELTIREIGANLRDRLQKAREAFRGTRDNDGWAGVRREVIRQVSAGARGAGAEIREAVNAARETTGPWSPITDAHRRVEAIETLRRQMNESREEATPYINYEEAERKYDENNTMGDDTSLSDDAVDTEAMIIARSELSKRVADARIPVTDTLSDAIDGGIDDGSSERTATRDAVDAAVTARASTAPPSPGGTSSTPSSGPDSSSSTPPPSSPIRVAPIPASPESIPRHLRYWGLPLILRRWLAPVDLKGAVRQEMGYREAAVTPYDQGGLNSDIGFEPGVREDMDKHLKAADEQYIKADRERRERHGVLIRRLRNASVGALVIGGAFAAGSVVVTVGSGGSIPQIPMDMGKHILDIGNFVMGGIHDIAAHARGIFDVPGTYTDPVTGGMVSHGGGPLYNLTEPLGYSGTRKVITESIGRVVTAFTGHGIEGFTKYPATGQWSKIPLPGIIGKGEIRTTSAIGLATLGRLIWAVRPLQSKGDFRALFRPHEAMQYIEAAERSEIQQDREALRDSPFESEEEDQEIVNTLRNLRGRRKALGWLEAEERRKKESRR